MATDIFGSPAAAPAQPAPKGAFGNGGGPQGMRDGSPESGNPPSTQGGQINHTPAGQGGTHALRDGSPSSGNPPSSGNGPHEFSALQGGPQTIPANRTPESGDGTGQ